MILVKQSALPLLLFYEFETNNFLDNSKKSVGKELIQDRCQNSSIRESWNEGFVTLKIKDVF